MSLDGDICAYIRGRKDKQAAIKMASEIFGKSAASIMKLLRKHGLMDDNGNYVEPIRLTGKEIIMPEQNNRPAFYWSSLRKAKLESLCNAGVDPATIAAKMETTEEIICQAIGRFNFCRTYKPELSPEPLSEPETVLTAVPLKPEPEPESLPDPAADPPSPPSEPPPFSLTELRELQKLVTHANILLHRTKQLLIENRGLEGFMAFGQQALVLQYAQQILCKLPPYTDASLDERRGKREHGVGDPEGAHH